MQIIQNVSAPEEIIRITREAFEGTKRSVIFDVGLNLGGDWRMGETVIDSELVFIDLEACARDYTLVSRGCTYLACVWFNVLYTIFHEAAHAHQLLQHTARIKEIDAHAYEILDNAAHKEALERMYSWAENGSIPELTRWGWLGLRMRQLLNELYPVMQREISDEVDCLGTEACAYAEAVVDIYPHFNEQSRDLLFEDIDKGEFGKVIKGKRYLTAGEFLAIHCE
jgi:hypothetical protein